MCDKDSNISVILDDSDSNIIVHDNTVDKSSEECWKCWKFPRVEFKEEVKVLKRKYCWLYPKKADKRLKEILPNFDECTTLYTKCDFKLEACVHEQLLKVENELKIYEKMLKKEKKLQSKLIEVLWELSNRLMFLRESSCCIKLYPEIVSSPTEKRTLCEFHTARKKLMFSNCRLTDFLSKIKVSVKEFESRCSKLDMTVESPFVLGKGVLRPIPYIRQMVADIYFYFYTILCKLKSWAQLIDPADIPSMEDYSALLKSTDDIEAFLVAGTEKCTCLRTHKRDCLKRHKPC